MSPGRSSKVWSTVTHHPVRRNADLAGARLQWRAARRSGSPFSGRYRFGRTVHCRKHIPRTAHAGRTDAPSAADPGSFSRCTWAFGRRVHRCRLGCYPRLAYGPSADPDADSFPSPGANPETATGQTPDNHPDVGQNSGANVIHPIRQCLLGALEAADAQASGDMEQMKQAVRSVTPAEAIAARPMACKWRAVWAPTQIVNRTRIAPGMPY
jgi:hypothetical protein